MVGQINLVGLVHNDLFLERDMQNSLVSLQPAAITHESHEDIIKEFGKLNPYRIKLEQAICASSYSSDQKEALKKIIIYSNLPTDYSIAKKWASESNIPFYSIDSNCHLRHVKATVENLGKTWLELDRIFREGKVDEVPGLNRLLQEVKSKGLNKTLVNINTETNNVYKNFGEYFSDNEKLPEDITRMLPFDRLRGVIGQRDMEAATQLKELSRKYGRIVHLGGLIHMVKDQDTLYSRLESMNPTRNTVRDYAI